MAIRKFYIRFREGYPETEMQSTALQGFIKRGIETQPFYGFGDIASLNDLGPEVGLSGYIGDIAEALSVLKINKPAPVDYPIELESFLGRTITKSNLASARSLSHQKLFIKPLKQKLFTGFCFTGSFQDQIRLAPYHDDEEVWLSTIVDFVSEYRCFILNGELIGVRHYKGDWFKALNRSVVEQAIAVFTGSPTAYTLDFGVTSTGETLLVECNEGYAMGAYGLQPELYAAMLEARWQELTAPLLIEPWLIYKIV